MIRVLLAFRPELEQRAVVISGKTLGGQHEQARGTPAAGGHQEDPALEGLWLMSLFPVLLLHPHLPGQSQLLTPCADSTNPDSCSNTSVSLSPRRAAAH